MSKGFTLIEISLVILIAIILIGVSFSFTSLSPEVLYLKNFIYKLTSDISFIKDLSFSRITVSEVNNLKACGYGIVFSENNYFAYSFVTSSKVECDALALEEPTSYAPQNEIFYIHLNSEIRREPLNPILIKNDFKPGISLKISLDSPNCDNDLFNFYSQLAFVFFNPYGDFLLLAKNGNWTSVMPSNWEEVFICLNYKNEIRVMRINRSGQVILESF